MKTVTLLCAPVALCLIAMPAVANDRASANPQIDYPGFSALVGDLEKVRTKHRLGWDAFAARASAQGAVLLDARSATTYARGHLKGAINLPFTDFTAEALREVLGDNPQRPIFIYCNNNFRDNRAPVMMKAAPLALNIPTFINLHGYGYHNVWELADVIGTSDPGVDWIAKGA